MAKTVLHHAYIEEGQSIEMIESWSQVCRVSSRDEGTGLDIWWFAYAEDD